MDAALGLLATLALVGVNAFFVVLDSGFTRLPLCSDSPIPVGIIHAKDLLTGRAQGDGLAGLCRPVTEVRADTDLGEVLAVLRRHRDEMAVVTDDGGWCGVVTLEDVLEQIVGSLGDEFE